MDLKKLDRSFFEDHTHLENALDLVDGKWIEEKVRGYGVVIIKIDNNLQFAIPIRSRILHKASYITKRDYSRNSKGKGLDFTKALLITKSGYIREFPFKISPEEHNKLKGKDKGQHIRTNFESYVKKYIQAVKCLDMNVLESLEYRDTTLVNYHSELGI